jgi:hypothetical protein
MTQRTIGVESGADSRADSGMCQGVFWIFFGLAFKPRKLRGGAWGEFAAGSCCEDGYCAARIGARSTTRFFVISARTRLMTFIFRGSSRPDQDGCAANFGRTARNSWPAFSSMGWFSSGVTGNRRVIAGTCKLGAGVGIERRASSPSSASRDAYF